MITPGTLASPLSFWCLDAKEGESSTRFLGICMGWNTSLSLVGFYACVLVSFHTLKLSLAWCKTCATTVSIQTTDCNI